ncbi:MAG: ABC transporter ATP-binding protein [Pseudomonadota bacterium]
MLRLSGVEAGYGAAKVLHGVSFEIGQGEAVALMGRNGMGKTTTVRTIFGLLPITSGNIVLEEASLTALRPPQIAKRGLALVPEGRRIFPNLTAEENLQAGATAGSPWSVERVMTLFPALEKRRSAMGNLLSGGEQQMLAIGRALMTGPRLIVLDEATEGLAPVIRDQIWETLQALKAEGLAILIIDKNLAQMQRFVDRFHVLEKGTIRWFGDAEAVTRETETITSLLTA